MRHAAWLALPALLAGAPAGARTLTAGPGQEFPGPAAAIRAAADGDTVLIEPGEYYECAVTDRSHLTIEGHGDGVVLTDAKGGTSRVTATDLMGSNGVIHVIDTVVMP